MAENTAYPERRIEGFYLIIKGQSIGLSADIPSDIVHNVQCDKVWTAFAHMKFRKYGIGKSLDYLYLVCSEKV